MILRRAGSGKLVAKDQLTQAQWDAIDAKFSLAERAHAPSSDNVALTGFCRRKCAMIEVTGGDDHAWMPPRQFAIEANGDVIKMVPA